MYSCGPPHMDVQEWDDQHELTYSSYVRTRDVILKTCRRRWMIGRNGERRSRISAQAARHDDDDNTYRWVTIWNCTYAVLGTPSVGKQWELTQGPNMHTHIYICTNTHTHTYIHTQIYTSYIYIYIYIYIYERKALKRCTFSPDDPKTSIELKLLSGNKNG